MIDLAPLVNQVVIPLLSPVLVAVAIWAINRLGAFAHISIQDGQRAVLETAIQNGIAFAQQQFAPGEHLAAPDQVAAVVDYVAPKIPGALKSLGVTPDHLAELVVARLPK